MPLKPVKTVLLYLATLSAVLSPSGLKAQSKVAVINFQQALLDTAEMKKAAVDLEAKYKPRQQEIDKLTQDLQEIQKKLESATDTERAALTLEGQQKQRALERKTEDLRDDLQYERNEILQAGTRKMREALAKLGREKDLDIIVDVSSALYFRSTLEITTEATIAYDKATEQETSQ